MISSKTDKKAADGTTPDTRTTVGVCEKVTFSVTPAEVAAWTADAGSPLTGSGKTFDWIAPEAETAKVTITATIGTTVCKIEMKVIKPGSAAWKTLSSTTTGYPAGNAGCQMTLTDLTLTPLAVNFERVVVQEVSGGPSNISGYFANNPPFSTNAPAAGPPPVAGGLIWHRAGGGNGTANGPWLSIQSTNIANANDSAGWPAPGLAPNTVQGGFTKGSFTWAVPMAYRCVDSTGAGTNFATIDQVFSITANGTMTVTKTDASICTVSRTP